MNISIQDKIAELQILLDATHEIDCASCRCAESSCAQCDGIVNDLEDEIENLKEALTDSDEPREWDVRDDGGWHSTIIAESAKEALDEIESDMDIDSWARYDDDGNQIIETVYVTLWAECELTGEEDMREVVLEPAEPKCTHDDGHQWVDNSDGYNFVELSDYACIHCGCARIEKYHSDYSGIKRNYIHYSERKYEMRMADECA